ncbi:hypothetical protein [Mesorhizobium sp. A623]
MTGPVPKKTFRTSCPETQSGEILPVEKPDSGLRRYLGIDPAIAETLEKAGL